MRKELSNLLWDIDNILAEMPENKGGGIRGSMTALRDALVKEGVTPERKDELLIPMNSGSAMMVRRHTEGWQEACILYIDAEGYRHDMAFARTDSAGKEIRIFVNSKPETGDYAEEFCVSKDDYRKKEEL